MTWTDKLADMRNGLKALNSLQPDMAKGFQALSKAAKGPGTLDAKTLEFVALGIAVADRCEPCIAFHVDALVRSGATRDEIGEVLSMCVQMGGGPSLMYAAKALQCFDELSGAAET
ncbi:carboxymuconolactone decarboxylase family protein [Meridianimarinicoccus sp. RP-17]|uniref:carboxymuconolactone decarboxylase family protein n=1 Tax=Meridianimarinicoccus zhengii TaxID=2056810 RepID=UPI000DADB667|nr:carboxymuconolactone decarboxylase family protein [Phycocomes zhengii]